MKLQAILLLVGVLTILRIDAQSIRSQSMGMIGTTSGDAWSTFVNPAGLSQTESTLVSILQRNHYRIGNWNDVAMSFCAPVKNQVRFGTGIRMEGFAGIRDFQCPIAISLKVGKRSGLGLRTSVIRRANDYTIADNRTTFSTSLGFMSRLTTNLIAGLSLDDAQVILNTNKLVPQNGPSIHAGINFRPNEIFQLLCEFHQLWDASSFCIGLEYAPIPHAKCRFGYASIGKQISGGIGITYDKWTIDASVEQHPYLGFSTGIALTYLFNNNAHTP